VWNALGKLAVTDPEAFIDYHRSDAVAVACEAWLGPRYQLTEQVNVVNPGGEAQHPHRDYHMGFLTDDEAYAVTAYLLYRNGIIGENDVMDAESLREVRMPRRDDYVMPGEWTPETRRGLENLAPR